MARSRGNKELSRLDIGLITVTVALLFVGLAALFSFSLSAESGSRAPLVRQAIYGVLGLGLAAWIWRVDYRLIVGFHWILYGVLNAALIGVLFLGQSIHGTTGWFVLGPLQMQPVEFVKIGMAIVLAKCMADWQTRTGSWSYLLMSGLVIGFPAVLVLMQPDFGSALVLVMMWVGMLLLSATPVRHLLGVALFGVGVAVLGWLFVLQPYQKDRVLTFIFPTRDALGAGYNVRQSLTAVGSGQWLGRGLGLGPQSQLNFLPERQTDFIFASISEELGFLGGGTVIVLYGLFFSRVVRLLQRSHDSLTLFLVTGIGCAIFLHVVVNIGMNLGLLPVTGIPLPFVSAGGSALLAGFLGLGLLESVALHARARETVGLDLAGI